MLPHQSSLIGKAIKWLFSQEVCLFYLTCWTMPQLKYFGHATWYFLSSCVPAEIDAYSSEKTAAIIKVPESCEEIWVSYVMPWWVPLIWVEAAHMLKWFVGEDPLNAFPSYTARDRLEADGFAHLEILLCLFNNPLKINRNNYSVGVRQLGRVPVDTVIKLLCWAVPVTSVGLSNKW